MIYDISPPISASLAVWPGDTPLSREVLLDIRHGANITLSTIKATVHLGPHADGPNHYGKDAPSIDQRRLDYYLGPCQVIQVAARPRQRITPDMINTKIVAPRILFATRTYPDPNIF